MSAFLVSPERVAGMPGLVARARSGLAVWAVQPHVDAAHLMLARKALLADGAIDFTGPCVHWSIAALASEPGDPTGGR